MARGVNKCILVGNLTRDVEVKFMPNGNAVANFGLATSDTWKDQQGQPQERTEWHNIVMYRKVAEIAGKYLKKGSKVYLEGKLQTSKWQDKDTGQDRYKTEINAHEMQMLDSRPQGGQQQPQQQQAPRQQAQQQQQRQQPQQQYKPQANLHPVRPQGQQQQSSTGIGHDLSDKWDEDIPF